MYYQNNQDPYYKNGLVTQFTINKINLQTERDFEYMTKVYQYL